MTCGRPALSLACCCGQPGKGPEDPRLPDTPKPAAVRYALGLPHVSVMVLGTCDEDELKQDLAWVRAFTPLTPNEQKNLARPTTALAARWAR